MNPFSLPKKVVLATSPMDMRAGIPRLTSLIAAFPDCDPTDESLYVFISKDAKRAKMIRFEQNGWVLYYVRLIRGTFKWKTGDDHVLTLEMKREDLVRFLRATLG